MITVQNMMDQWENKFKTRVKDKVSNKKHLSNLKANQKEIKEAIKVEL